MVFWRSIRCAAQNGIIVRRVRREACMSYWDGIKTLKEWFGPDMRSVSKEQAQGRAYVCIFGNNGKGCPNNHLGGWSLPEAAADFIKSCAEKKLQLRLSVSLEENLGTCTKCKCRLSLKVHVPFKHIYNHTSDEQFAEFPDFCWLTKERKARS